MIKKYTATLLLTVSVLMLTVFNVMAQPGGGTDPLPCDPDDPCPIDTWVFVLAFVILAGAVWDMYRKQNYVTK